MAECMTPRTINRDNPQLVPCGKCPACAARNISQWSFRLVQEMRVSTSAKFITLTYDTTHVPITPSGRLTLNPTDVRNFFKRLRKAHVHSRIKYFAVGEYGGNTKRPHYHIILLNANIELIQKAWPFGQVNYGDERGVNEASIGYCLKYIHKTCKIGKATTDDRVPSFSRMSKGLGLNYLTGAIRAWHHADPLNRMYCNLLDGKKISMPRYYKLKLYEESLRQEIGEATLERIRLEKEKEILSIDYHQAWRNRREGIQASFRNQALQAFKSKV